MLSFSPSLLARNPFEHNPPNPFQAAKVQKPAMNQLVNQSFSSKFTIRWPSPKRQLNFYIFSPVALTESEKSRK